MLTLVLNKGRRVWNEDEDRFEVLDKDIKIQLEHSLISLTKWEAIYHKSFSNGSYLSSEELEDYIKCMTVSQNIDSDCYRFLSNEEILKINKYIDDPMTATKFSDSKNGKSKKPQKEYVTSTTIYYWMIEFGIPFECQKWHLNQLLTLIRFCEIKESQANDKKQPKIPHIPSGRKMR